jgi:hypothetical protein
VREITQAREERSKVDGREKQHRRKHTSLLLLGLDTHSGAAASPSCCCCCHCGKSRRQEKCSTDRLCQFSGNAGRINSIDAHDSSYEALPLYVFQLQGLEWRSEPTPSAMRLPIHGAVPIAPPRQYREPNKHQRANPGWQSHSVSVRRGGKRNGGRRSRRRDGEQTRGKGLVV